MVALTQTEHARLEQAVADAEKQTSAEIVLSVVEASDDYEGFAQIGAGLAGLVALIALAVFLPGSHVRFALMVALAAAVIVGLGLQARPLRLMLVPRSVRTHNVARRARLQFADAVAGRTKAANGLLIFVSLAEHQLEIIPDRGLAAKVPETAWQEIVAKLPGQVQREGLVESLATVVSSCTEVLARAFPYQDGDVNEIADAVLLPKR